MSRRPQKLKQQTLPCSLRSSSPPQSQGPRPPTRKRARKISTSSSSNSGKAQDTDSDVGAIRFEPGPVEVSDDDRSLPRPRQRKRLAGAHAIPVRAASDDSLEDPIAVPRKGRRNVVLDSDDDARPRKRKLIKGARPPTPDEDDDILDTENMLEDRLRSRGKISAFQRNLEKLKMLKGKKRGETVLDEAEQSESSVDAPFEHARPHRSGESDASRDEAESSEGDEESFIVDDEEQGLPAARLPPEFSLSTHQDLAHHFKIVCQLFVHVAIQPLADRRAFLERALKEEEYLSVPLHVTRRKLSGMRDSLVASSVWRPEYKKMLETHPKFSLVRLDFAVPECDACHLGGRSSTFLGRLSGKRYDKYDFEDISDDEDEGPEEERDDEADKESGVHEERDIEAEYNLGRFCAARTRVYHQYSHWEYSLYRSLQREVLDAQDETRRFVKVAYVGGIEPPRDLHDADGMMEWLDERGIVDMEWQKVRQMMDAARSLERGGAGED